MASAEQLTELTQEMRRLAQEVNRLSQENNALRQQQQIQSQQAQQTQEPATGGDQGVQTQMIGALSEMTAILKDLKKDGLKKRELMDGKGIGAPTVFTNKEDQYPRWMRKVENHIVGVFGEDFRQVMYWAASAESQISKEEMLEQFGPDSDEIDRIDDIAYKNGQWYLVLDALTQDESNDLVIGAGTGNGAEAWRKINKRWDPLIAGRKNALLKHIIHPPRCKMEELVGCWERWEEQVRRYERRKTEDGRRTKIADDTLMAAFESLVPEDLENHLVLNCKRISTYQLQKEEVQQILDCRIGGKIKEFRIKEDGKGGRDGDVNAFSQSYDWKGKAKGKGKGKGSCFVCGAPGHYARDCPSKGKGGKSSTPTYKGKDGKYGGKGYGDKTGGKWKGESSGKGKQSWPHQPKGYPKAGKKSQSKGKAKDKGFASLGDEWNSPENDWQSWQDDAGWNSWSDSGGWQQGADAQSAAVMQDGTKTEQNVFSLDVGAFDKSSRAPVSQETEALKCVNSFVDEPESWLKINYDTGAAVSGFPEEYAPSGSAGNGDQYTTATGELVQDRGGLRVVAQDENGRMTRIQGRIAKLRKILCSGSKCAQAGQNGWITNGGGYLIPDNSALSHKIKKLIDAEAAKSNHELIPLYLENGVYNFYIKVGSGVPGSKVETLTGGDSRVAPRGAEGAVLAAVRELSKEELEMKVVEAWRSQGLPGFPRQLRA